MVSPPTPGWGDPPGVGGGICGFIYVFIGLMSQPNKNKGLFIYFAYKANIKTIINPMISPPTPMGGWGGGHPSPPIWELVARPLVLVVFKFAL